MTAPGKIVPTAFPKKLRVTNTHDVRSFERLGVWFKPATPVVIEVGTGKDEIRLRACRSFEIEYLEGEPFVAGSDRAATTAVTRVVAVEDAPEPDPEPVEQRPAVPGARVTVGSGESVPAGR